jgi:hypothetical protein
MGAKKRDVRVWPITSFRVREQSGRFQSEADIKWQAGPARSVAIDPTETSGLVSV